MPQRTSDGPIVAKWIETFLVHSTGDFFGQPFRLTPEQKRFLESAYALKPDGTRRHRRVLLGRPKGYGKTELAAAVGLAELAGPTAPVAPDIPVAAASYEQADLLFGAARTMASEGPLAPYLDVFDTEILLREGPGRMYRVAAAAGTNDGARPTFLLADEVHEWTGSKERVHLVLANGLMKRQASWELSISTAGSDLTSLLGRMYQFGRKLEAGELEDEGFLFDWLEHPDPGVQLDSLEAAREAVRLAYREAGHHVDLEAIVRRFEEVPEYEFRRYYLNQFTATALQWLPTGAWERCSDPEHDVPEGTTVVLGFDGSYSSDSTALVGCTLDERPHLFVVGVWERPDSREEWVVPRDEVATVVQRAMERYRVRELACDPPGWHREIEEWRERYGAMVTVEYQTNRRARMADACSRLYTAVVNEQLSHDGHPRLAAHIAHAVVKETPDGAFITKERRDSPRKIDLAVAAVIAHDRASVGSEQQGWATVWPW